jgi:hypothetical protein
MTIYEEYVVRMFDIALTIPRSHIIVFDSNIRNHYNNYWSPDGALTIHLKDNKYKGLKVNKSIRTLRFKNKSRIYFHPYKLERQVDSIAGCELTAYFMHNYYEIPEYNRLFLNTKLRLGSLVIPENNKYFSILPKGFIEGQEDVKNKWSNK